MGKNAKQTVPDIQTEQYSFNDIVIDSIRDKKGEEIVILDLREIPDTVTDFFILCHAGSTTQVRAIGNHITEKVFEKTGLKPFSREGFENAEWILIDYLNTVVHVFHHEKRYFYNLEDLWHDAGKTRLDN